MVQKELTQQKGPNAVFCDILGLPEPRGTATGCGLYILMTNYLEFFVFSAAEVQ